VLAVTERDALVELHRRHVWPPYTSPERHAEDDPLVIGSAEGAWLIDLDGRRYLDGNASWWTCTLGHRHPRLVAALARQLASLDHVAAGGITHPSVVALAAELCAVAPRGLERVHFSDDGSTAVEAAIKIAFQYWQQTGQPRRRRFVSLASAYHGDTLGAISLAGRSELFEVFGPLAFDVLQPDDLDGLATLVRDRGDELAAIVIEPMLQGAAGMRMQHPEQLARIRELADAAGTLLVADEVFTGYGRTGAMWACDLAGISPDLMCVAKGFTAGLLPMAATLATARIYDGFRGGSGSTRALMHGHSFCGHPLGAAVAREVLAIYREERIVEGVAPRAALIAEGFARIARLPGVIRTRSLGIVGAADLGEGGYHGALGRSVYQAALRRGLYARPLGDTVYLCPPLIIPLAELEQLLAGLHDAIAEVTA
jgi:adenosylmethionine---8-amino-7-oxononanoate aminotransferase